MAKAEGPLERQRKKVQEIMDSELIPLEKKYGVESVMTALNHYLTIL